MRNTIKMMRLSKVKYFLYMETELFIHLLNTHAGHNVLLPSFGGQSVYSWDTCLASIQTWPKPTIYYILFIHCQDKNKLTLAGHQLAHSFQPRPLQLQQNSSSAAHTALAADPLVDYIWKGSTELGCS